MNGSRKNCLLCWGWDFHISLRAVTPGNAQSRNYDYGADSECGYGYDEYVCDYDCDCDGDDDATDDDGDGARVSGLFVEGLGDWTGVGVGV